MNSDSAHSAEDSIYDAARHLADPLARAAFLDQACADNPVLRQRLDGLLNAAPEADDFFTRKLVCLDRLPPISAADLTVISPPVEKAGDRIANYKLLEQIGEGGFGTVWMAEQTEPVTRRVALKIIKLGMDTREVIARFEQERQALAIMDHPNIAKVFEAGATERGRPFFVMELVKGAPITHYCDEARLGTRERLALFGDVCAAINHAHQKGVIHRDIKPSNVMVTLYADKPVVKVIDFGIAKATQGKLTEKTLFTGFEQFIGTPVYMSPEQASHSAVDIDTRSDIYALGILLYELLAGKPPFDAKTLASAGYEEMLRIIREVEPPKPSSRLSTVIGEERTQLARARQIEPAKVNRIVEPDLDWIVMKAIEKDRARRYETANDFAQDIQRYLTDEPVSATPPSAGYRFRKFARRNKAALRVAAGIASILVIATATSTGLAIRATNAEALAADRLTVVEVEKQRAVEERQISQSILNFLQYKLLLMADVTAQADSLLLAGSSAGSAKPNPTILELLDRAAQEVTEEKLEANFPGQPVLQAEILDTIGASYQGIGRYHHAVSFLERGLALKMKYLGPESPHTLKSMNMVGIGLVEDNQPQKAIPLLEECVHRLSPSGEPSAHAKALNNLAIALQKSGRPEMALPLFEELLSQPSAMWNTIPTISVQLLINAAHAYRDAGKPGPALRYSLKAMEQARASHGPKHPRTLIAMNTAALVYMDEGKPAAGLPIAEEAYHQAETTLGPNHPTTLLLLNNLALLSSVSGNTENGLRLAKEAFKKNSSLLGPDDPQTLAAMMNLGGALVEAGRVEEAIEYMEQALQRTKATLGPDHPQTLAAMNALSPAYQVAGRLSKVLPFLQEAMELHRSKLGADHPTTLASSNNLAVGLMEAGQPDKAVPIAEEMLKVGEKILGAGHPDTLLFLQTLLAALENAGHWEDASKWRQLLITRVQSAYGPEDSKTLAIMAANGLKLLRKLQWSEAEPLLRDCLKLREKTQPDAWTTSNTKSMLGGAFLGQKRWAEAEPLLVAGGAELMDRRSAIPAEGRMRLAEAFERLVTLYEATNRPEQAAKWREELSAILDPASSPPLAAALGKKENKASLPAPSTQATQGALIASSSEWKWLHPTDGKDPAESFAGFHTSFFRPDFDDSQWKTGHDSDDPDGGFGYGLTFTGASIGKPDEMANRRTAYFRHTFKTFKAHRNLELRCRYDDGIIVYLDGKEILRDNMPAGPDAFRLTSLLANASGDEQVLHRFRIAGLLATGAHTLAISVHNCAQPSSDLRLGGVTLVETTAEAQPPQNNGAKSPTSPRK